MSGLPNDETVIPRDYGCGLLRQIAEIVPICKNAAKARRKEHYESLANRICKSCIHFSNPSLCPIRGMIDSSVESYLF